MNLFVKALANSELFEFIIGEGDYFVADREYGDHCPLGSYKLYIEEYLSNTKGLFGSEFWLEIIKILESDDKDLNIFIDYLIGYLTPYYHKETINRTVNTPSNYIYTLTAVINSREKLLEIDTRGTGAQKSIKRGLWGSIKRNLEIIHERGGPEFLIKE